MHYRLAKLLSQAGKQDEARREVLKSLEEAPRFLESHRLLLDLVESDTVPATGLAAVRSRPLRRPSHDAETPDPGRDLLACWRSPPAWPWRSRIRQWQWRRRSPLDGLPTTVPACRTGRSTSGSRTTSSPSSGSSTTPYGGRGRGRRGYGGWGRGLTDWPDSDLNFSYRLQQLTSLKVNPEPITLKLTDEPAVRLSVHLHDRAGWPCSSRKKRSSRCAATCSNGGFLMVDDFWGDYECENFYREIKRVFPETDEPEELPLDHEIFQCVYRLKEKPQVPSIHSWSARLERDLGGATAATSQRSTTGGSSTTRAG